MNKNTPTQKASETPEVSRKWKAVAYAYPTSENATQFGFGKTGCYVVETSTNKDRIPNAIAGFATSPEAFAFADTLTDHELSQWSVSPEFRVYTPYGSPTNIGL